MLVSPPWPLRLHRRLVGGKHWSFHCKALWYTEPTAAGSAGHNIAEAEVCDRFDAGIATGPSLTVVGSSNFGRRSMARDLEAQFWLVRSMQLVASVSKWSSPVLMCTLQVTDDSSLRTRLRREQELILNHTEGPVDAADDHPCWRVRLLTFCFLRFL